MRSFTTADLNKQVGTVTDAARRGPVVITHHRKPRYVLMSVEAYEQLTGTPPADPRTGFTLDAMPDDLRDGLLALADAFEEGSDDGRGA
jgi:prevent-host-death family protein